jgi:hypothetical protein
MRLSFRVAIVLIICLAAMALPAAPAQAVDTGASVTLDPNDAVPGTNVTIEGDNFTAHKDLDIYYYRDAANTTRVRVLQIETDEDGDFEGTFVVPESYTGIHEVRAYIGTSLQAAGNFTVVPGLAVSPKKGPVGTNVTVVGHGFAKNEKNIKLRYYLDGNSTMIAQNITADEDGRWNRVFQIPLSAQGNHKIDAEGEDSSLAEVQDAAFEVTPGISLDKSSGSPGEGVAVTGRGFAAGERDITMLFGGEAVKTQLRADTAGYWRESFQVPERPKGTYNVTAYGESTPSSAVSAVNFNISPSLLLSPGEGHVSTNLTVTGKGFAANKDVDATYDGSKIVTGRTDSKGNFNVTFAVPQSRHGTRQVTASDAAGNVASANFTMESNPPDKPEPISPPDKSRVGFIGEVTPTFQWSEVSDESGVRYSLQVAASANVTTAGEFAEPLLSKEGLVGTNYTLNATEALPYGTYYWIVQAIDGAENESAWTAARSFRAGLLPLWAFILGIVVAVAVVGTLVYFFAIRKRVHYY